MTEPFLTAEQRSQLLANGLKTQNSDDQDHAPVVKLFTPDANATWLLTEIDPYDSDMAYGLCDLGLGEPEFGTVSISELAHIRGPLGLRVEVDTAFKASGPISTYLDRAIEAGRIVV
jgi:hypothetical protein